MSFLLAAIMLYTYSPADSVWNMVTLGSVPPRALLFAELAAREGGQAVIDLGLLMEISGRFEEAGSYYTIAAGSAEDTLTSEWLDTRIIGTAPLDTLILLAVVITNGGPGPAEELMVEVPLPVPHPPYQELELFSWGFQQDGSSLSQTVTRLPEGTSLILPMAVRISQSPYTYRPLDMGLHPLPITVEELAAVLRSVALPGEVVGPGPCLEAASDLASAADEAGLLLEITGGLLRSGSGELLFHAWNTVPETGLPMDRVLFGVDSLRGLAHASTDLIPLWDLGAAEGHEVSLYFAGDGFDLEVGMEVAYADMDVLRAALSVLPSFIPVPEGLLRR